MYKTKLHECDMSLQHAIEIITRNTLHVKVSINADHVDAT